MKQAEIIEELKKGAVINEHFSTGEGEKFEYSICRDDEETGDELQEDLTNAQFKSLEKKGIIKYSRSMSLYNNQYILAEGKHAIQ